MSPWIKGERQSEAGGTEHPSPVEPGYPPEQERRDQPPKQQEGWKISAAILATLMVAPFALSKIDWSNVGGTKQPPRQEVAASIVDRLPDDVSTGAMCDLAVKRALASEDSFDPEWGGSFHAEGNIGVMSRKFDATNGFGAKLTSRYTCKWDSVKDRIVSLTITDPFGETTKLR